MAIDAVFKDRLSDSITVAGNLAGMALTMARVLIPISPQSAYAPQQQRKQVVSPTLATTQTQPSAATALSPPPEK